MTKENINFEDALKDFESTVQKLNNSDLTIDEATKLHEEGMEKCKICEAILDETTQKIETYIKEKQEG